MAVVAALVSAVVSKVGTASSVTTATAGSTAACCDRKELVSATLAGVSAALPAGRRAKLPLAM
jgi:hypothetical protein